MVIGIIAAMEEEMLLLKEAIGCDEGSVKHGVSFYEGALNSHDIIVCSSGIGKVNSSMATTLLIECYACDVIINTGIAGGITGVEPKDIVIATGLMYHDVDVRAFGYAYGQVPQMPRVYLPSMPHNVEIKRVLKLLGYSFKEAMIYSGDSFVHSLNQITHMDTSIPCITEMEGASIAQVCVKAGVDFVALRYVSDVVGTENQIEDYQAFEKEMANRSAKICVNILKNLE